MNPLEVIVTGNVSGATTELKKVQAELGKTALDAQKTDSSLQKFSSNISNIGRRGTESISTFDTSIKSAGISTLRFGEIAKQAVPQVLSTSLAEVGTAATGATAGIGSLIGSIAGAGGVTIAISLLAVGVRALIKEMAEADESVSALDMTLAGFEKTIKDAKEGIKDFNDEAEFLKKLGSLTVDINFGSGFEGQILKLEQASVQLTDAIFGPDGLSKQESLLTNASRDAFKTFEDNASDAAKNLKETFGSFENIPDKFVKNLSDQDRELIKGYTNVSKELTAIQDERLKKFQERETVYGAIHAVRAQQNREEIADEKAKAEAEAKRLAGLDTIIKEYEKLIRQLGVIKELGKIDLSVNVPKQSVSAVESTIRTLVSKFGQTKDSEYVIRLIALVNDIKLTEQFDKDLKGRTRKIIIPVEFQQANLEEVRRLAEKAKPTFGSNQVEPAQKGLTAFNPFQNAGDVSRLFREAELVGAGVSKKFVKGLGTLKFEEFSKRIAQELDGLTTTLKDTFLGLSESIGESIGKAVAGGGSFLKNALGGVFNIMGDFLIQLGKAAILTSKLFLAIKASKINPIQGIIGGIAAIAAGFLLKSIKLPEFAVGGHVSGAGTKTSDSIPARLSVGEYVNNAASVDYYGVGFFNALNSRAIKKETLTKETFRQFKEISTLKLATGGLVGSYKFSEGGLVSPNTIRNITNNNLKANGSININITGRNTIRGNDIVTAFERATATNLRNG